MPSQANPAHGRKVISVDLEALYPNVVAWMAGARRGHPLSLVIESVHKRGESSAEGVAIVAAFEQIIAILENAKPDRLPTERADFRKAKTWEDLLITRAELVAGAKLAQAGIPFDFGARSKSPQPDLLLKEAGLGVEVKARRLDGLRDLHDELEDALENANADVIVTIACRERPLYFKPADRSDLIADILKRVSNGSYGAVPVELDQSWAATPKLRIVVQIVPGKPLLPGQRVFIEGGEALTGHLTNVESEIITVLTADEQKANQAASMPTLLLVDVARTGLSWIRPERVWAQMLAARLPENTPFIGAAVMVPRLDSPTVEIAMAARPNAAATEESLLRTLAGQLGLAHSGGGWFG